MVSKVLEQVESLGIQLYPLPECDDDEDDDYKQQCQQLKVTFGVITYLLFSSVNVL